eukprot:CAMPEP_0168806458 /NCGR_PEP_ID=MMETSP0726-20121227/1555_1 /TAXON_ID=265536 /ORGANISM="Amphiprora sp., Strain CCMP467" /LENGTH=593 /DNA_ID=CAMNT_0008858361 /DNA_START=42 /DNA_END=1823 /DNA_ORIENTATION=-
MGIYTRRQFLTINNHCGQDLKSLIVSINSEKNFDPSPYKAIDGKTLHGQVYKPLVEKQTALEPGTHHSPNKITLKFVGTEKNDTKFSIEVNLNPHSDSFDRREAKLNDQKLTTNGDLYTVLVEYDHESGIYTMDIFEGLPPANWTLPGPRPKYDVNWSKYTKEAVVGLLEFMPDDGFAAKIVDFFWPDNEPSIWDQIKDQVKFEIKSAILNLENDSRLTTIKGIKDSLGDYNNTTDWDNKGNILGGLIVKLNDAFAKLTSPTNENTIHFLPLTVTVSILHMSVLREQLKRTELLDQKNGKNNSPGSEELLSIHYNKYFQFFKEYYVKWEQWRFGNITTRQWEAYDGLTKFCKGEVRDNVTGLVRKFKYQIDPTTVHWRDTDRMKHALQFVQRCFQNEARAEMATVMAPAFFINRFMKGHENDKPATFGGLSEITMGPYNYNVMNGSGEPDLTLSEYVDFTRRSDAITMNVDDNVVRGIQDNNNGKYIGNEDGHDVSVPLERIGAHICGARVKLAGGWIPQIGEIEFVRSDGTSTGPLPKKSLGGSTQVIMNPGSSYSLVGGRFAAYDYNGGWNGQPPNHNLKTIEFRFKVHGL